MWFSAVLSPSASGFVMLCNLRCFSAHHGCIKCGYFHLLYTSWSFFSDLSHEQGVSADRTASSLLCTILYKHWIIRFWNIQTMFKPIFKYSNQWLWHSQGHWDVFHILMFEVNICEQVSTWPVSALCCYMMGYMIMKCIKGFDTLCYASGDGNESPKILPYTHYIVSLCL